MNFALVGPIVGACALLVGAVIAYRKIKPESDNMIGSATEAVTNAAVKMIETQRAEINGLRERVVHLEANLATTHEIEERLARTEAERDAAEAACERLIHRVEELVGIIRAAGLHIPPEPLPALQNPRQAGSGRRTPQ